MPELIRSLTVLADGEPLPAGRLALSGREAVGLFPSPFTLRLWNLPEESFLQLSRAGSVSVQCGDSCLAAGTVTDVCRQTVPEGTLTEAVFSPGLALWEAQVSLSVPAGTGTADTVRAILEASGTGIPLLSVPDPDLISSRSQAFFGRAAECIEEVLSGKQGDGPETAQAMLVPSGLYIIPPSGLPVSLLLSEQDLMDAPVFAGRKPGGTSAAFMLLSVSAVGFRPGQAVSLSWHGETFTGLIRERQLELWTSGGPWVNQLLIEL